VVKMGEVGLVKLSASGFSDFFWCFFVPKNFCYLLSYIINHISKNMRPGHTTLLMFLIDAAYFEGMFFVGNPNRSTTGKLIPYIS
jgi:hypothetical protein